MNYKEQIRLLVIEDNPGDFKLVQELLKDARGSDIYLENASTFKSGVQMLQSDGFDTVLLDLSLPDSTGGDSLQAIRSSFPNIPVVIYTGLNDKEVAVSLMQKGAQDYLVKGSTDGDLINKTITFAIERQRSSETLQQSEARFKLLFENAALGIEYFTPQGKVISMNKLSCFWLGKREEDVIGKFAVDVFGEKIGGLYGQRINQVIEKQLPQNYETLIELPSGQKWFSSTYTCILDTSAKVSGVQVISEDITEKVDSRLAIERMIETEKEQRLFAEALVSNSLALNSSLVSSQVLDAILVNVEKVVPFDTVSIMEIHSGRARIVRSKGFEERGLSGWVEQAEFNFLEIENLNKVVETGKPLLCANTTKAKGWKTFEESSWIKSSINAPIMDNNSVFGFLNVDSAVPDFYTEMHLKKLDAFTGQVSVALKNARMFEQIEGQINQLKGLKNIDIAINSSLDIKVSLETVASEAMQLLQPDAVDILVLNVSKHRLETISSRGFKSTLRGADHIPYGKELLSQVFLDRSLIKKTRIDLKKDFSVRGSFLEKEGFVSYYCAPLISKGIVLGVIEAFFRRECSPDQEWMDFFMALAYQTAIAINNSQLFTSLQVSNQNLLKAYDATIKGWAKTLELHDRETKGHSQRVTDLALQIARKMGIIGQPLVDFQRGAFLHDLGKMGIPETILNKPGKLDDAEWALMKKHPVWAFDLIADIEFLKPAADIPHFHHEKWDGTGYPDGLKGEAIPLFARIFAVVDVYDALISDRSYRPAWPLDKTLAHIKDQSGIHFDPKVVDVFLGMKTHNEI